MSRRLDWRAFAGLGMLLCLAAALASLPACSKGSSSSPLDPDGDADGDTERELVDEADSEEGIEDNDLDDNDLDDEKDGDSDTAEEDTDVPPAGSLDTDPAELDFGPQLLGVKGELTLSLLNTAERGGAITVTSLEWTVSSEAAFGVDGCVPPFDIAAASHKECVVSCLPTKPGALAGTLRVIGHDAVGNAVEKRVGVRAESRTALSWVERTRLDFGYVAAGEKGLLVLSLGNAGHTPWALEAPAFRADSDPAFTLLTPAKDSYPLTLGFNEGRQLLIAFTPTKDAEVYGYLVLKGDDAQVPERVIALSGRGAAACPETGKSGEIALRCAACVPGETRCATGGAGIETCTENGREWAAPEACDAGRRCVSGVCVFAQCEAEAAFCAEGASYECAQADRATKLATCIGGDSCTLAVCAAGTGCGLLDTSDRCDDANSCTADSCEATSGCAHATLTGPCPDPDLCTINATCQNGRCLGAAKTCDDDNPCTADSCAPATGCVFTPDDGKPCSDTDICTIGDQCANGQCVGAALSCDVTNACLVPSCDPAVGCVFAPGGADCDDGNPCTERDSCATGRCAGTPRNPDDGLHCNGTEVCDPVRGILHLNPVGCNDGLACTIDRCDEASSGCVHTPDSTACDDLNPCTIDTCASGAGCLHAAEPDGKACTFVLASGEVCMGGVCVAPCTADVDCRDAFTCTFDTCDKATRTCRHETFDALCDDGAFCNGEERCDALRGCVSGPATDCDDTIACTLDRCDAEARACIHEPKAGGCDDANPCTFDRCDPAQGCISDAIAAACDDGDPCTVGDACMGGRCQAGSGKPVCEDGNACTDDVCVPGEGCAHIDNARNCDDGLDCTTLDTCTDGVCRGVARGCDDGRFCNGPETCGALGCLQGVAPDCDDNVACTTDSCNETPQGCLHIPNDAACDDRNPCTQAYRCTGEGCEITKREDGTVCGVARLGEKTCRDGLCIAPCENDADCDDGVDCTQDACDADKALCTHAPADYVCDDHVACNGAEVCHPTLGCQAGPKVLCDDGIACTRDSCDETSGGCLHTADNTLCSDLLPCTNDVCGPTGCTHETTTGVCDDHDPCTLYDTCGSGTCSGTPRGCDDSNPCTADFCTRGVGCEAKPLADGSPCVSGGLPGVCAVGACVPGCRTNADCDDALACTLDICNAATHACDYTPVNERCSDGRACNGTETCDALLGCVAGVAPICDDGVDCTTDRCDERTGGCAHDFIHAACVDFNDCTTDVCTTLGCRFEAREGACDDGNACTTGDTCENGFCASGQTASCNDANACTQDACDARLGCYHVDTSASCATSADFCMTGSCDPASGCRQLPRTGPCSDGSTSTVGDQCSNGFCAGHARDCDDRNPCTNDTTTTTGCAHEASAAGVVCSIAGIVQGACQAGVCLPQRTCLRDFDCQDGVACTSETCNTATRLCVYTPRNQVCDDGLFCNGAEHCEPFVGCVRSEPPACDDLLACTADHCDEGAKACAHTPLNGQCDDGNLCTEDACVAGSGCTHAPIENRPCDDGNACTVDDVCTLGHCGGSALSCDDHNPCTLPGACNPVLGCVNVLRPDRTPCGVEGECLDGLCAESCTGDSDCADAFACTRDVCDPTLKRCRHYADDTRCDDGLVCNGKESCRADVGCLAGTPPSCLDGVACTQDACDELAGGCIHSANSLACDDGNPCTDERCDAVSGCVSTPHDGLSCDDGNACTSGETCKTGQCQGGTAVVCGPCYPGEDPSTCDPTGGCTLHACDPRVGCVSAFDEFGSACGSDACSALKGCLNGQCVTIIDGPSCEDGNICTENTCDPRGGCLFMPISGIACSDDDACTVGDSCRTGHCQGTRIDCEDNNLCTEDTCDSATGCVHTPIDEGAACAAGRTCHNGLCVPGCAIDADCLGALPCGAGRCAEGKCEYACAGTGNACDGAAYCDPTAGCLTGAEPNCADKVACTVDACDAASQTCTHLPDHSACDDGDPCTQDACDAVGGCVHTPLNETPCALSGDACVLEARCLLGECMAMAWLDCDDANLCTSDACAAGGTCTHTPQNGLACDDGIACTRGDTCAEGVCVGVSLSCDDGNACTSDTCDGSGLCKNRPLTGDLCVSRIPCGTAVCINGGCREMLGDPCNDGDAQTLDVCESNGLCSHR